MLPSDFVRVTIRFVLLELKIGDQKRVMTPQEAHKIGSDYIVVDAQSSKQKTHGTLTMKLHNME